MSGAQSDDAPHLHVMVFAGPNGSGKTSLIDAIRQAGLATSSGNFALPAYFINPDQVAKDLQGDYPDQNARNEAAQRASVQLRVNAMASKKPFAYETVMSHPTRISELLMLKEQDYRIFLVFITTDDPEKNVARVTLRYETNTTTGHYVLPEKVRDRYRRTLALLPRAAEIADAVFVYDNSIDFKKPTLQAVIERDVQFSISPDAKAWVIQQLVRPLQQRERELNQLLSGLERDGHQTAVADELHGTYTGEVISRTPYYLAQLIAKSNLAVIHDRLILETGPEVTNQQPICVEKEHVKIRYSATASPKVNRIAFPPTSPTKSAGRKRKSRNP